MACARKICQAYGNGESDVVARLLKDGVEDIKIDFDDTKDGSGMSLMDAMKNIDALAGDQQWRMLNSAAKTMYQRQILSINEKTKSNYQRLLKEDKLYKPIKSHWNEYMKCDAKYLESNTIEKENDGLGLTAQAAQAEAKTQEMDRVSAYVKEELEMIIGKNVKGKASGAG